MATKYVSLGSIKREGNKLTVSYAVKKKHRDDIDSAYVRWVVTPDGMPSTTVDKRGLSKSGGRSSITLKRSKYNPSGAKLRNVTAWAIGYKDGKPKGAWSSPVTFAPEDPEAPSISKSVDASTGTVTFTVATEDPDTGKMERHDTRVLVKRSANIGTRDQTLHDASSTATSIARSANVAEATSLGYGQYVRITCEATARGLHGNSSTTKEHVFARPNRPVIESAVLTNATANDPSGGIVVVTFDTKATRNAPVDEVQLWRLQSASAATSTEAANAGGWTDVSAATDDGTVRALTDNAEDAVPVAAGTRVWYRVSATHDALTSYSDPVECGGAYTDRSTTTTGTVTITGVDAGEDWVKLTLTDTEADDDIIRVMWSDYENAWESNEEPGSYDVTWADNGIATIYVKGLEAGTRYWFRARPVDIDADGDEVLGGLSEAVSVTPIPDFGPIAATVPQNVPAGSDMTVTWSFMGGFVQERAWVRLSDGADEKLVEAADGVGTTATVPWEKLEGWLGQTIDVSVAVESCSALFESDPQGVVIADAPTCALDAPTLAAQPAAFTLTTDSANSPTATVAVTSLGSTGSGLDGDAYQLDGDCIWSGTVSPEWSESNGTYTATVELPEGLVFWDGSSYTATAVLHDPVTGLDSEPASQDFDVEWEHQAGVPEGTVEVDASALAVTVTVDAPEGYQPGDRFDLYRSTADGDSRIAAGLPFGSSVTDRLAPFGDGGYGYIAVTRTADGDWEPSATMAYELPHKALRFDWNGTESLSAPYDIEDSASYGKGYESEAALGGGRIGWWDGSVDHRASLKTNLVKLRSADERAAAVSLARFAGPVFVRTPLGAAFPANVRVSDIGAAFSSGAVGVSLSCEETALTDEHRVPADDISLPEWGGGSVEVHGTVVYDAAGGFPMDGWTYIGTSTSSSAVFYVCDEDGTVRDQDGSAMEGYTWDGTASIADGSGNVTELDGGAR